MKEAFIGGFAKSLAQRIRRNANSANIGLSAYSVGTLTRALQKALTNTRTVLEDRYSHDQQTEVAHLDAAITANLDSFGFGVPRE